MSGPRLKYLLTFVFIFIGISNGNALQDRNNTTQSGTRSLTAFKLEFEKYIPANQQWGMEILIQDEETGRVWTVEDIRDEQVTIEFIIDGEPKPTQLIDNRFRFVWNPGPDYRHVEVFVRTKTRSDTKDSNRIKTTVVPDSRIILPPVLSFGTLSAGCEEDEHCALIDFDNSLNLYEGLTLSIKRTQPKDKNQPEGWSDLELILRYKDKSEPLLADSEITISYSESHKPEICYAPPGCVEVPEFTGEFIEIQPVSPGLEALDKKNPGTERGFVFMVAGDVEPNSWLDCNLWWILLILILLMIIFISYGIISPNAFSPNAFLRVSNKQSTLRRAQARALRNEPHGRKGFYRSATCCFNSDGITVRKTQGHVLMLKATSDLGIDIFLKGAVVERLQRHKWYPVDLKSGENSIIIGDVYRVNQTFFFCIE